LSNRPPVTGASADLKESATKALARLKRAYRELTMFVYIIQSAKDGSIYVGSTQNIKERLLHHNAGYNLATRNKAHWEVLRLEEYLDRELALKRERFLKTAKGRRVVKNLCSL
jgi:putative endonuclease